MKITTTRTICIEMDSAEALAITTALSRVLAAVGSEDLESDIDRLQAFKTEIIYAPR